MPIHGLEALARFPRREIIKLGVRVPTKAGDDVRPQEVDYFVVPPELRPLLGDKPKAIVVLFPADEMERLLTMRYERYSGRKGGGPSEAGGLLTVDCDGRECREIPLQGETVVHPCWKEPRKPCRCGATASARLNVMVMDGPVGTYQVRIGGEQRIADLQMQLQVYHRLLGRLTGIPFILRRVSASRQIRDDTGKRLVKTGWPVRIDCQFTVAQALRARGLDPTDLRRLPALPEEQEPEHALIPEAEINGGEAPAAAGAPGPAAPGPAPAADRDSGERLAQVPAEEFDISIAFQWAGLTLGVSAEEYRRYLERSYGTDVDNLPLRAYGEQREALLRARESKAACNRLRAEVLAGAAPNHARPGQP